MVVLKDTENELKLLALHHLEPSESTPPLSVDTASSETVYVIRSNGVLSIPLKMKDFGMVWYYARATLS